ncbi:MAG: hypothetical protein RBU30_07860 [Polyangia bacterium]|jgi:hypothetical protein|nr:hypothetical protein [Polyangia bacterium]
MKYKGTWGIRHQPVQFGAARWLHRSKNAPTGLQCTRDGRFLIYAEEGGIYARSLAGSAAPRKVASLPGAIWDLHRRQIRAFVAPSPSGRYLALPDPEGVRVHDLETGKDLIVKPPTTGDEESQKVRVIHPPRWMPDRDAFLYLTQQGDKGRGAVNARVFDLAQGRHSLWFPVLTKPVLAVEAFDAIFNAEGTRIGLTLAVRQERATAVRFRIFSVNPYKALSMPGRVTIGRLHGFDPRLGDILFTGHLAGQPAKLWSYSFTRKSRQLLDTGFLSSGRMVLGFYPERRTALVAQPYDSGPCSGKAKLYKASSSFTMTALVRWAAWTEVVAEDPTGAWLVFRSGSTCNHKSPTLYLMMADGWGLLKDMDARFAPLRTVDPQDAALCPLPPPPSRPR